MNTWVFSTDDRRYLIRASGLSVGQATANAERVLFQAGIQGGPRVSVLKQFPWLDVPDAIIDRDAYVLLVAFFR